MIDCNEAVQMERALDILETDEKRFWKEIAPDLPPRAIDEILYLAGKGGA